MEHKHSVHDSDTRFSINPITRQIKNDSNRKIVLIQNDHMSEVFTFECPRTVEGHDMSLCNEVEVHFLNIASDKRKENSGFVTLKDFRVDPEDDSKVVCSWEIDINATRLAGSLNFLLFFKCKEDDVITYGWHTAIYEGIFISKGINADESFEKDYVDVIERWKAKVMAYFTADLAAWKETTVAEVREEAFQDIATERKRIDLLSNYVTPQMFGAVGDGVTDDTDAVQAALNNHRNVYIPEGVYMIRTSTDDTAEYGAGEGIGVEIPSNTRLVLHPNAVLKGIPNLSSRYRVLWATDSENIHISGGRIECDRTKEEGQHGFGIALRHCENVLIEGVIISNALGDCINIGCYADDLATGSECSNISIRSCELYGARRQGLTIGGVDGCRVDNCYIHDINGTDPQAGIDIEVNDATVQINDNIRITNTAFENNIGYDIVICQNEKTNVMVDGCQMTTLFNENGVTVTNCSIGTMTAASKSDYTKINHCEIDLLVSYANDCICVASMLGRVQSANMLHIENCYMKCTGENIMLHAYGTGHVIVNNSTIISDGCTYAFNGNKFEVRNCVIDIKAGTGFERGFYAGNGLMTGCDISIDTVEKPLFAKTGSGGSIRVVGNKIRTDFQASVLSGTTDFYIVGNVFFVKPSANFNNDTLVHDNIVL